MYLMYLDDSGSVGNAGDRHFILAGLAVPERAPHWLSQALDRFAENLWPDNPGGIEFRGSDIFAGRKHWRGIARERRQSVYEDILAQLTRHRDARLFGAVVHKAARSPEDPVEYAFEQLCNRFDLFLGRMHKGGDTQRGLIILDESSKETTLQRMARDFRSSGHRWGKLHNLAEVPLFVDSKATRMIQLADLVAYALRRYYEAGEAKYYNIISGSFDWEGDTCHGLTHFVPRGTECSCASCRSRYWQSR